MAIRRLAKERGFTFAAVLTVALAIGANTAIFTLVHALMFRSLPVADPAALYRLGDGDNCCVIGGYQERFSIYSYPLPLYLRDHNPEFQQMAAFQGGLDMVGVHRGGPLSPAEPFVDQSYVVLVLALCALAAGLRPALRASSTDPVQALRTQ